MTWSPTVEECRNRALSLILGRGCGTSLAGQTCNVAVVIDFSKYLNPSARARSRRQDRPRRARHYPRDLNNAAEQHHLTFAPDPATHQYCTVGGMIGNNSCGVHSVMGGKTVDNIEELEILTYDGLRMRVGRTSDAELQRIIAEGRPARRDLSQACAICATVTPRSVRAALPANPAACLRLQSRSAPAGKRLQCGARAGRLGKAPASSCSARPCG